MDKPIENKDREKDRADWARLIYRNYIDGIDSMKRRQWAATNYVLLMFAAIIGFSKLVVIKDTFPYPWLPFVLLLIALLISLVGIYHLIDMHCVMTEYRQRVRNINMMSDLGEIDPIEDYDSKFLKYFFSFTLLLVILIIIGFFLVGIYLTIFNSGRFCKVHCILTLTGIDILFVPLFSRIAYIRTENSKKDLDERQKL